MKKLLIITLLASLAGCQTQKQKSHQAFQAQIQEIEQARAAGEISKGEYLKLKQDAENAWRQREGQRRQAAMGSMLLHR